MMECEIEPREGARLRASEQCCALFSARGTTDLTITEIASEIGISQRTFYRYFPVKAESVGPVFDWSIRRFNAVIVETDPDISLTVNRTGIDGDSGYRDSTSSLGLVLSS
ncbi:MAG TPA: TetR/AcrR family transcriptional regulator [Candidatus Nesterenkonia stercoripullorum]|uniref:TetR/AcrR family transcriptional regulator n=1 Tax=Candidatus Nesterenkonia stercoripullorum TaxID=2838701 RepID=A0A9D2A7V4_9MICC|nr:TetR/AcrR family transcriptional regulator [Candidatus Nesterenkonia stercoripullorum]